MADSITLTMDRGMANKTGLDPSNSGTTPATAERRGYILGPPTNGSPNMVGRWGVQTWGTQTNSNSATAATYGFIENAPYYTVAPTSYNYVALDSQPAVSRD